MVKSPRFGTILLLGIVIATGIVLVWQQLAEAKKRTIRYFPQSYSMEMIESATPHQLVELVCQDSGYADKLASCTKCEGFRKACPDCCFINSNMTAGQKCQAGDPNVCNGKVESPFKSGQKHPNLPDVMNCTDWRDNSGKTKLACPATTQPTEKDTGKFAKCRQDTDGAWICSAANLVPKDSLELSEDLEIALGRRRCGDSPAYQEYGTLVSKDHLDESIKTEVCPDGKCYRYMPTQAFISCVERCVKDANAWETCQSKSACCKVDCYSLCLPEKCQGRIDNKTACAEFGESQCLKIKEEYQEWIMDGRTAQCFRPIDEKFAYTFVGKTGEAVTFRWQIFCKPEAYVEGKKFYTMLRIFKGRGFDNNNCVFSSIIHQKDFNTDFTLTAATTFNAGTSGEVYTAMLCYFIPQVTDAELLMNVDNQQLFIVRNRE